jgi:rhodanese-related sulfurtransferase
MKHASGFRAIVNDAKKRVKESDFREIKQRLDAGEKFTLVDVREDNEWAKGHLPGAIHLGKGVIERDVETAVPEAASVRPWPPTTSRKWATPTASPWTAAGARGPKPAFPPKRPNKIFSPGDLRVSRSATIFYRLT